MGNLNGSRIVFYSGKTFWRLLAAPLIFSVLVSACKSTGRSTGHVMEDGASTADNCDNAAMARRRAAVFERSASCAASAAGVGIAEVIRDVAIAAGEFKAFAAALRAFNDTVGKGSRWTVNVAKGTLCASVFTGSYVPITSIEYATGELAKVSLSPDSELYGLDKLAATLASGGGNEIFESIHHLVERPSGEALVKVLSKATVSFGAIGELVNACSPVFSNVASVAAPNIVALTRLGQRMGNVAVIGGIVNCSAAGLFNAIDVGAEVGCLQKDLQYIAEQNQKILRAERAICSRLGDIANLPTSIPIIEASLTSTDSATGLKFGESALRQGLCNHTISSWGACVASQQILSRSKDYCQKICSGGFSETAKDDAIKIAKAAGPDANQMEVLRLVRAYSLKCIGPGNPEQLVNDGVMPCVNACMQGKGGITPPDIPTYYPYN